MRLLNSQYYDYAHRSIFTLSGEKYHLFVRPNDDRLSISGR